MHCCNLLPFVFHVIDHCMTKYKHCVMDHYMTKYGSAVIHGVNLTVWWANTWANMEVIIMHTEAFISSPIFIRIFVWMIYKTKYSLVWDSLRLTPMSLCLQLNPSLTLPAGSVMIYHQSTHGCLIILRNKQQQNHPSNFHASTCLSCKLMCTPIMWWWKVCLTVVSI